MKSPQTEAVLDKAVRTSVLHSLAMQGMRLARRKRQRGILVAILLVLAAAGWGLVLL